MAELSMLYVEIRQSDVASEAIWLIVWHSIHTEVRGIKTNLFVKNGIKARNRRLAFQSNPEDSNNVNLLTENENQEKDFEVVSGKCWPDRCIHVVILGGKHLQVPMNLL